MNEVKLVKLVDTYKIDFTLHWKTFFIVNVLNGED